jgi:Flp pilus assembly pilin Flp
VRKFLTSLWRDTDGVLSFEWTMLTSLLTVGAVSGIATVRDAVTDEMGDLAQAMVSLDQTYYIEPPLVMRVHDTWRWGWNHGHYGYGWNNAPFYEGSTASSSAFIDASSYRECDRSKMKVIEFPREGERAAPGAAPAPGTAPAPTPAFFPDDQEL